MLFERVGDSREQDVVVMAPRVEFGAKKNLGVERFGLREMILGENEADIPAGL